jgi:hypothetical protein
LFFKFLRQIASFADTAASRPFPRLFIIDLYDSSSKKSPAKLTRNISLGSNSTALRASSSHTSSQTTAVENKGVKFCLRALCECESGWHSTGSLIQYEQLKNIPQAHYAYLYRIMNLLKITSLDLDILSNVSKLDELIEYIQDHLPNISEETPAVNNNNNNNNNNNANSIMSNMMMSSNMMSSQSTPQRTRNNESIFSFKESYNSLKSYLNNVLDNQKANASPSNTSNMSSGSKPGTPAVTVDTQNNNSDITDLKTPPKKKSDAVNLNRVEHFELNRCQMPSGKIVWLCDEHSREDYVQILTSAHEKQFTQYQNDEFNAILFEELKKFDVNVSS